MKRIFAILVMFSVLGASEAEAGRIERACKASDRKAVTGALCACVQKAANAKLTRSDRRLAAKFFKDPDLAQATRQSDDPRKERFWKRYKAFSVHAAKTCQR
jgi:hypothetical protein